MTVSTTSNYVQWLGNGATTIFSYAFPIPLSTDVLLTITDSGGTVTTLLPTQYSITGIGTSFGGAVTYPLSGSPLASGNTLTLQRVVPYTQPTSIVDQSGFYPAVIEGMGDNLEMQIQQLASALSAAIAGGSGILPPPQPPSSINASSVVYNPPVTSPAILNVSTKFQNDVLSLLDYDGADPTSGNNPTTGADNSVQAQRMMNDNYGLLVLPAQKLGQPPANFLIKNTVTWRDTTGGTYRGSGIVSACGTQIRPNLTITAPIGFDIGDGSYAQYTYGFNLRNVSVNGNNGAQTSDGFRFRYCSEMNWDNFTLRSFKGRAFGAHVCYDAHLTNGRIQFCSYLSTTGATTFDSDGQATSCNHWSLDNVQFEGNFWSDIIWTGVGGGGEDFLTIGHGCKFGNMNYLATSPTDVGQYHIQATSGHGLSIADGVFFTTGGVILLNSWNGYCIGSIQAGNLSQGITEGVSVCNGGRAFGTQVAGNGLSTAYGSLTAGHNAFRVHSAGFIGDAIESVGFGAVSKAYVVAAGSDHAAFFNPLDTGISVTKPQITDGGTFTTVDFTDTNRTLRSTDQLAPISGIGAEMFYDTGGDKGWFISINRNSTTLKPTVLLGTTVTASTDLTFATGATMLAGGTTWTAISDERLKNIIGLLRPGLTDGLRSVYFRLKTDDPNRPPRVGFIAQDFLANLPELVANDPDSEFLRLLCTEPMTAVLTAEVQDLRRRMAILEAK